MNKSKKVNDIYLYVNELLGIDIADKNRSTEYVEGRALFYVLCMKHTNLSKSSMGNYVGKNHCAVIHALNHTINVLSDHRVIDAYNDLQEDKSFQSRNDRLLSMMSGLTEEQYDTALFRIEAMVKMIAAA